MVDRICDLSVVNSYAGLPTDFYTRIAPQPLNSPRFLHVNAAVAAEMGLSQKALADPELLAVCAGAQPLPGGIALAAVYSGHQFGVWAGQLGDGRAHLLGEVVGPDGPWEWQLKGSGRTPYSRMGDGRAVLRSSLREYLASEAMHGLGIPTTRALAIVVSDDPVYRETVETAAIVTRVAPSFVRFGTFEHFSRAPDHLQTLLDYVVERFYPECAHAEQGVEQRALCFLEKVVSRTARLIADWMTVGFCHGVMNTDNMSVLGLTLDYGPYGFMDGFQANHICNTTDSLGRYAWNAQPSVANWNLHRLAGSLLGLDVSADSLKAVLQGYEPAFRHAYQDAMRRKFGLLEWSPALDGLADEWWKLLHTNRADFTLSFRRLADAPQDPDAFLALFEDHEAARAWLQDYAGHLAREARPAEDRRASMNAVNPLYVLRNHLAQEAIEAAQAGDAAPIDSLLEVLRDPYVEHPGREHYCQPAPQWAQGLSLSCSS